jgi:hypothetical protein
MAEDRAGLATLGSPVRWFKQKVLGPSGSRFTIGDSTELRVRGKEKKTRYGQKYNICGRWIVATWAVLSPDEVRHCVDVDGAKLTENYAVIPNHEPSKQGQYN